MAKQFPDSHFSFAPSSINIPRTRFRLPQNLKTTLNAGDLVPIYFKEVLAGDSFRLRCSNVTRMSTMLYPVMDNAFMDTYFFFVPYRLVWSDYQYFFGEHKGTFWDEDDSYEIPQIKLHIPTPLQPDLTPFPGSLWDYFGLPVDDFSGSPGEAGFETVSALPFRAYALIWNEFFRDQNSETPCSIDVSSTDHFFEYDPDDLDYVTDTQLGVTLCKVNKYHDVFTSCLPFAGSRQQINIVPELGSKLPVYASDVTHTKSTYGLHMSGLSEGMPGGMMFVDDNGYANADVGGSTGTTPFQFIPDNLFAAVPSGAGSAVTVNMLREAVAIQRLLEVDGRNGSRYRELLKGHFSVTVPDLRVQVPEYLGGNRTRINVQSVAQTSATAEDSTPLASLGGMSHTADSSFIFDKSFDEPGMIIGVCCVRTAHTYQTGIDKFWTKRRRYDFYYPELANIGEQPVYERELFSRMEVNGNVFGFQEAWYDYRYSVDRITGQFRSNVTGSLDAWHYADDFGNPPTLTPDFLFETKDNIDRTLAVSSSVSDQFLCDFDFDVIATRPMPMYSIPSLFNMR